MRNVIKAKLVNYLQDKTLICLKHHQRHQRRHLHMHIKCIGSKCTLKQENTRQRTLTYLLQHSRVNQRTSWQSASYPVTIGPMKDLVTLECGPMPNVMVALPNTGGALCSTPQSLADARY